MPLIICTVFFAVLFICEALWFQARSAQMADELCRYERVEHPRSVTSDGYIDFFS